MSLIDELLELREKDLSLREIARQYGDDITHADIQRALQGINPKGKEKRCALGLPETEPAPVCPSCNIVHLGKCTGRNKKNRAYTRSRNATLNAKAQAKGWKHLSECLTAVLRDEAALPEKEG